MKSFVTLAFLFAAIPAFANQTVNLKVGWFLADLGFLRTEISRSAEGSKTREEVKTSVCRMLTELNFKANEINFDVLAERHPTKRRRVVAENVVKKIDRALRFCGDQSGAKDEEKVYNLAEVLMLAQSAGSLAQDLVTEPLPEEGQVNCDFPKEKMRLAIDPSAERLWFVRLNNEGKPDDRIQYELRVMEVQVVSVSYYRCKGCYDYYFKGARSDEGSMLAKVRNFNLSLFDASNEPKQIWDNVTCWIKK